jgi:hypothetical protein
MNWNSSNSAQWAVVHISFEPVGKMRRPLTGACLDFWPSVNLSEDMTLTSEQRKQRYYLAALPAEFKRIDAVQLAVTKYRVHVTHGNFYS